MAMENTFGEGTAYPTEGFSPTPDLASGLANGDFVIAAKGPGVGSQLWGGIKNVGGKIMNIGGNMLGTLKTGATWAVMAYTVGFMLGGVMGLEGDNSATFAEALGLGVFAGRFGAQAAGSNFFTTAAGEGALGNVGGNIAGGVIGFAVFAWYMMENYEEVVYKTTSFECKPWQAPTESGAAICEKCNDDDLPCSEYRCKSLGQSCELVNEGTVEEKCVDTNPHDVTPPIIKPNDYVLTEGYKYNGVKTSPPDAGFKIERIDGNSGCIEAFTPITFGITVDEPAQCKIDYQRTKKFDDMKYYFGSSNLFKYNHSQQFALPGARNMEQENITLFSDGELTAFIRCKDTKGNENQAEFAARFCVDPEPDTTVPQIKATTIADGSCVASGTTNTTIKFYTNEPARCRWSKIDQDYDSMDNDMVCPASLKEINTQMLYTCIAELTGITRDNTKYYIRCEDQPTAPVKDRNQMRESYEFSLREGPGLRMRNLEPTEDVFGSINPLPTELTVQTSIGCDDGKAVCFYSADGSSFIRFKETDTQEGFHSQKLFLGNGDHNYTVKCVDSGGNLAINSTKFNVEIDTSAPSVVRIYEENSMLKLITTKESECVYMNTNCDYLFEEGTQMPISNTTEHITEWNKDKTYYVKCRDDTRPAPVDCTITVKPSDNFE